MNVSYIKISDSKVQEQSLGRLHFLILEVGSWLKLCDSASAHCAKKSLETLQDITKKALSGKYITLSGKEALYTHLLENRGVRVPFEKTSFSTQKEFEKFSLKNALHTAGLFDADLLVDSFFEHHDLSLYSQIKNPLFNLLYNHDSLEEGRWKRSCLKELLNIVFTKRDIKDCDANPFQLLCYKSNELIFSCPRNLFLKHQLDVLKGAAQGGQRTFIDRLVTEKGLDIHTEISDKRSILHFAAQGGHQNLIEWLTTEKGLDIHTEISDKRSILHFAAQGGHQNLIEWLTTEKGFNIHQQDNYERSILHFAAQGGHQNLIEWLTTEKGFNIHQKDNYERSILHFAAQGGHQNLIQWLTTEKGFNIHQKDNYERSILHFAALGGHQNLIQWLTTEKSFNIHQKNKYERSILHFAAQGGYQNLIEWLTTEKGFNIHQKDNYESSILHFAAAGGHQNLIEWLTTEKGLNIHEKNTSGLSILHQAAWLNHQDLIEWLTIEKGFDIHQKNNKGSSILHIAAMGGHQNLIKWLTIEKGFNIHEKNTDGLSILHQAAWRNHQDLIEWLTTEKGFDIHQKDKSGNSILHKAVFAGHLSLAKWLVENHHLRVPNNEILSALCREHSQEIKVFLNWLHRKQSSPVGSPTLTPQPASFDLPGSLQTIPEPETSWTELLTIPCKPEHKAGLVSLHNRIVRRVVMPSTGGEPYYQRMEKYVGHLLNYIKKNPSEHDIILEIFSDASGRCGGILEEFENLYFLRCQKIQTNDLIGSIKQLGWQWRQQAVITFIGTYTPDVHQAHALRAAVAPLIGTVGPQEVDRLGHIDDTTIVVCCTHVSDNYPTQLIRILLEQLKAPAPVPGQADTRLKIGDRGWKLFEEALMDDMILKGTYPESILPKVQEELRKFKANPSEAVEKVQYALDEDDIRDLSDDPIAALAFTESTALEADILSLRKAVLYPILKEELKEADIAQYLITLGWMKEEI